MFILAQGHQKGQRKGVGSISPIVVVNERQLPIAVASDAAHFPRIDNRNQFLYHDFFGCKLFKIESRLIPRALLEVFFPARSPSFSVSEMPSASNVRRISARGAPDLPFSTSTIHWRPTPTLRARSAWLKPNRNRLSRMTAPKSTAVLRRMGASSNVVN